MPAAAPLVLTWLRAIRDTKLSLGAKALAGVLVTYANSDGSSCRPGDDRLRDDLTDSCRRLTARSIKRYRAELVKAGLLVLIRRGAGPGRGRRGGSAAEWRLILPDENTRHPEPSVSGKTGDTLSPVFPGNTRHTATKTPDTQSPPTSPRDLPKRSGADVDLQDSGNQQFSLSPREELVSKRLPAATTRERELIIQKIELQKPVSFPAYLRRIPDDDLQAILAEVRASAPGGNGNGPYTNACRAGDHRSCGRSWCTCACHVGA